MIFEALKKFKKALKKYQLSSGKHLEDDLLVAILLLIAVRRLNISQPNKQFDASAVDVLLEKKADLQLLGQCQKLYRLVCKFGPQETKNSLPAPLLDSIVIARTILDEDLLSALADDLNSIGFVYQIFNSSSRKLALAAVQSANKVINNDQLIAFTQLYTPTWVVDFLLANTVFPVLKNYHPTVAIERFSQWLLEPNVSVEQSVKIQDLKLLDPACGAGHFLLAGFDLLLELYVSNGINSSEAIRHILFDNLHGADIDDKALWISCLALLTKCLLLDPTASDLRFNNLCWSNLSTSNNDDHKSSSDALGSLSRHWLKNSSHPLGQNYQVVVTNPPYIGRKLLSRELKVALQEHYPNSHVDLCAAFITRSLEMLAPNGRLGVITQASLLTLPSYKEMRNTLSTSYKVSSVVDCGTRVFPLATGEKINSLLLVAHPANKFASLEKQLKAETASISIATQTRPSHASSGPLEDKSQLTIYLKLKDAKDKAVQLKQQIQNILRMGTNDSSLSSGSLDSHLRTFSDDYLPTSLKQIIFDSPKLASLSEVRQGLATTDNNRFVRYWWDVDTRDLGEVWVPYCKGAGSERWYSDNNFVVRWGKDGAEIKQAVNEAYPYLKGKTAWVVKNEDFYFRSGLCFSFINKSCLAVRRLPSNCIFDVASSAIFPSFDNENFLLAYLNSSLISSISTALNPTINLQVGDLKRLPLFRLSLKARERLGQLGETCYKIKRSIVDIQNLRNQSVWNNSSSDNFDVEICFQQISSQLQSLATNLIKSEREIDTILLTEIGKLAHLDETTMNDLSNWVGGQSNENNKSAKHELPPAEFATRLLAARISQLLSYKQGERIVIYPSLDENGLYSILGLNERSITWLENALQKNLVTYFDKSTVLELGKTARIPSRYFSLRLADPKCLVFASSRAFRQTMEALNNSDRSVWDKSKDLFLAISSASKGIQSQITPKDLRTIFSSRSTACEALLRQSSSILSHKTDWTTKDLIQAINECLLSVGSTT